MCQLLLENGLIMNEKIKGLAQEAGIWFEDSKEVRTHSVSTTTLNRFAGLIVQECIKQVEPTPHHEVWAQSYLGGVDGLELLESKVKQIKKHFGDHE